MGVITQYHCQCPGGERDRSKATTTESNASSNLDAETERGVMYRDKKQIRTSLPSMNRAGRHHTAEGGRKRRATDLPGNPHRPSSGNHRPPAPSASRPSPPLSSSATAQTSCPPRTSLESPCVPLRKRSRCCSRPRPDGTARQPLAPSRTCQCRRPRRFRSTRLRPRSSGRTARAPRSGFRWTRQAWATTRATRRARAGQGWRSTTRRSEIVCQLRCWLRRTVQEEPD